MEGMEDVEWDKVCGRGGVKMAWAKKKLREGEEPEGGVKEKQVKVVKVKKERPVGEVKEERERREWIDYDAEDAPPRPAGAFDRAASRTVIVQGIPVPLTDEERAAKKAKKEAEGAMDVDEEGAEKADDDDEEGEEEGKPIDWKKVLKQKAKKTGDVEEVQWPVLLSSGEVVGAFSLASLAAITRLTLGPRSHYPPPHPSHRARTHEEAQQPRLQGSRHQRLRQEFLGSRPAPRSRQGWRTSRRSQPRLRRAFLSLPTDRQN